MSSVDISAPINAAILAVSTAGALIIGVMVAIAAIGWIRRVITGSEWFMQRDEDYQEHVERREILDREAYQSEYLSNLADRLHAENETAREESDRIQRDHDALDQALEEYEEHLMYNNQ